MGMDGYTSCPYFFFFFLRLSPVLRSLRAITHTSPIFWPSFPHTEFPRTINLCSLEIKENLCSNKMEKHRIKPP